ncbi:MAG: hypothetical protein WCO45_00265 [Pseudanabaena sp. ELA607]
MSFVPFSIDLETIIAPDSAHRNQFEESQIETLANLFLQVRDTIKPIIVRKISPISFAILEGYLEYYAALKAEQIDEQFTSIQAYIVPPQLESSVLEQYDFFRSLLRSQDNPLNTVINHPSESKLPNELKLILAQINTLASRMDNFEEKLASQLVNESKLESIVQKTIQKYIAVTESVNPPASKPESSNSNTTKTKSTKTNPTKAKVSKPNKLEYDPERAKLVLDGLNNLAVLPLTAKLSQVGITTAKSTAKKVFESRLVKPYESMEDILSRTGADGKRFLTESTLPKLLDNW